LAGTTLALGLADVVNQQPAGLGHSGTQWKAASSPEICQKPRYAYVVEKGKPILTLLE
jgi:hypothetical protein